MNIKISNLKTKIFADGADLKTMINLSKLNYIKGLTTNPTLMRKAGVKSYLEFSKSVLRIVKKKSLSLEVFADDPKTIEKQAIIISKLAKNVYVKIPIMNTKKKYLFAIIKKLSDLKIKLNITAIMNYKQVKKLIKYLNPKVNCYISIFAGRIADTGRDPVPILRKSINLIKNKKKFKIIWASTREVFNIIQANKIGCHIITVGNEFLKKLKYLNYSLEKFSLDTVKDFYKSAKQSKLTINE
jgi:transaldolase